MLSPITLEEKLDFIQDRIYKAATSAGRNPNNITLIAVTKTLSINIWEKALEINLTTIGESNIQETIEKSENFTKRKKIKLHLIGHLQSNKVKKAINLFDVIQTVDSIKLAERINRLCINKQQQIYIQINTAKDPKKHGLFPEKAEKVAEKISTMDNLILRGIMTISPKGINKSDLSKVYNNTRKIRDNIYSRINDCCQYISMGMSNDYETAIAEGATHIRIGTGLFGERKI